MARPHGTVYLTGQGYHEPGWRGLIYDGYRCLFRGAVRGLRSASFADMKRWAKSNKTDVDLAEPLADEVLPWPGYGGEWPE